MTGKFRTTDEVKSDLYDWGRGRWISHPPSTGAKQLTVLEGTMAPGKGHNFHRHLDQEEVLYVIAGKVEQWIDREKRILGPGDAVFIPAGIVHATFTVGQGEARLVVIFGPSVGAYGFEPVEVAGDAPWNGLRS